MNKKKLIREQLDASLQRLSPLLDVTAPPKGWIRAIRDALGMTAKQLANRLGVAQQAVARIEKEELPGSVTIKTMRRIAECLDCVFVYGFVPRTSLGETVTRQAKKVAAQRLARASQTMSLENKALSRRDNEQALSDLVDELMRTLPSNLWNKS
ncbi:MAG: mobile mystery protein A [Deltaproteobacteria bacterium]|nr:mobile mystery protein A [Deltaproteobacteria bacterium]MBW1816951.1 mobile mystery protein A [Deltaproteobacteria bacterium]